jgi:hypothetical protein
MSVYIKNVVKFVHNAYMYMYTICWLRRQYNTVQYRDLQSDSPTINKEEIK